MLILFLKDIFARAKAQIDVTEKEGEKRREQGRARETLTEKGRENGCNAFGG